MTITGGGKRGSGGGNRQTFDKDDKIAQLNLEISSKLSQINQGSSNPITAEIIAKAKKLSDTTQAELDNTIPKVMENFNLQSINTLIDSSGNGNGEYKMTKLTKIVFWNEFSKLAEFKNKVTLSEQLMRLAVDVAFTYSYVSEKGDIQWTSYVQDLSDAKVALSKAQDSKDATMK